MKSFRISGVAIAALAALALFVTAQGSSAMSGQTRQSNNPVQTHCVFNQGRLVKCGSSSTNTEQGLGSRTQAQERQSETRRQTQSCIFNQGRLVKCGSGEESSRPNTEQGLGGRGSQESQSETRRQTQGCIFNQGRLVKCGSGR